MPLAKWILIAVGLTSLAVGVIGIFVPLLPTTVFLLIAAACFARSSDRLHTWLLGHRWFGPYISNYREHRAVTLRAKRFTIAALWLTITLSMFLAPPHWWIRAILLCVAVGVTVFMLRLRTMTPEMERDLASGLQRRTG